jgi:uncharacterized repeat protein (TIGR03943 family)
MQATHSHDHHHPHEPSFVEAVQPWLKTLVLLGLSLYFSWNIISGNLANYINNRFAWLSYLAAALFMLLALSSAYTLLRNRSHQHDHDHHDHNHDHDHHDHDHDHDHGGQMSWVMLLIVALPLVLGTLVPSRPLGADAIDGNVAMTAANTTTTTTAFTISPLDRNVLDWLRIFNSVADYEEVAGEPADLIGFVYSEPNFGEDHFMVARFTLSCCVADASAIGVPVAWDGTSELRPDTWVRVQGTFQVGDFREDRVPVLQATSVDVVEQPDHPYLYP